MTDSKLPKGYKDMMEYGLVEALLGRRARRFFRGAEIPDGVFAYKSNYDHEPLTELEKMLVLAACAGNTSWHHMIQRAELYAPHLSNYAGAAGGRTFPSAAGFHTSKTFFTDDEGVYVLDNRDAPAFAERNEDGTLNFEDMVEEMKKQITKLQDGRLKFPPETPHIEAHNTWVVNHPGTLLVIPVADVAQHMILGLCYMLQNNFVLYDDINKCAIPGIEKYSNIVDINNVWPFTFVEQLCLTEATTELSISCYAGALMLNAIGLGGWMFDGISPFSFIGASGDPNVPGLGFRYDFKEDWAYPNPTGLEGVMESHCPPHYPDMRAAVEAVVKRKFGSGGPFNGETPGPWKDSKKVRSAAQVHDETFIECVAMQAQYVYDKFGKFPGTVPSIYVLTYLQAHHLDLEFYDKFYKPGAYLKTHSEHIEKWHGDK
ncbi:hypothetical protein E9840_02950 [Tissierella creatinini]|nr:hypothetical protein E9840_02950 [Tissierella creatinini]TJX67257.1 hypothetical protein E8P77_05635 [Soehngenia saccharolytica]